MKLKKIDLSGVKSYLFQKGERIGLAICAVIGLLLLGMGLMKAGGSTVPYAQTLKNAWGDMERKINVPEGPEMKIAAIDPKTLPGWTLNTKDIESTAWINVIQDFVDNKRQNPTIYKVQEDEKHLQIDSFRGGYFAYELEKDKVWAFDKAVQGGNDSVQGGPSTLVKIMKPARFVVVTGVFPWKDQMEEFRRKLHYGTMAELVAKQEDMPKPLGLNVYRCEVLPGGKEYSEWEIIFKWDAKEEKVEVAQRIQDLFKEAFLDVDNPSMLTTGKHLQSGLVTPLPQLANLNLHYPKLNLQGIKQDDTKKGKKPQLNQGKGRSIFGPQSGPKKGPPGTGGTQQEPKMSLEPWTKFSQPLQDQFNGKIGYFDPYGIAPESAQANMQANIGFQGQKIPNKDDKIELEDVVVRFVDVNVEPGKTYMYIFAVRMANPNFGKTKDVAFTSLAVDKELISEYTRTPAVSIPGEYYYYAVDQKPDQQITDGSDTKPAVADYPLAYGKWTTPVQVHRWLSKFTDGKEWVVADWAVAERLLTRRGDSIGRYGVMTEVPVWDKGHEDFEIGVKYQNAKAGAKKAYTGLPIDYIQPADRARPPLLVDFEGGWKTIKTSTGSLKDESAVEILTLTPSGKLEVRNSRDDTDLDNPVAQERHTRWENWLKGIRTMHNPGGGNAMPGG
jgi:hypothetical protein